MQTSRPRVLPFLFVVSSLLFASAFGCSLQDPAPSSEAPTTEQLRRVTSEVPSFGGVLFEDGRLVVTILGSKDVEAARLALGKIFGSYASEIDLRVLPESGDLSADVVDTVGNGFMDIEGVHGVGFGPGYLVVYANGPETVKRVQERIVATSVSSEQVLIKVMGPFKAL